MNSSDASNHANNIALIQGNLSAQLSDLTAEVQKLQNAQPTLDLTAAFMSLNQLESNQLALLAIAKEIIGAEVPPPAQRISTEPSSAQPLQPGADGTAEAPAEDSPIRGNLATATNTQDPPLASAPASSISVPGDDSNLPDSPAGVSTTVEKPDSPVTPNSTISQTNKAAAQNSTADDVAATEGSEDTTDPTAKSKKTKSNK